MRPVSGEVRNDVWGSGEFASSRGAERLHRGIDLKVTPNDVVVAPISGKVTKIGRPYSNAPQFHYVQIDGELERHRVFYIVPCVGVGDVVEEGEAIGRADDVRLRYNEAMTPHIHWERMVWVDPLL